MVVVQTKSLSYSHTDSLNDSDTISAGDALETKSVAIMKMMLSYFAKGTDICALLFNDSVVLVLVSKIGRHC